MGDFAGALVGSHSHEMAVGVMALTIVLVAQQFGYAALTGAALGFLWFNAPPAEVFMGDVGALGIGGAIGAVAVSGASGGDKDAACANAGIAKVAAQLK